MEAGPDTDAQTSSHLGSDLQASPCRSCFASVSSTSMMGVPGDQLSLIQLPLTGFSTPLWHSGSSTPSTFVSWCKSLTSPLCQCK